MASDSLTSMLSSERTALARRQLPKRPLPREKRWLHSGYLFVLPYVCMLALFGIVPTIFAIVISFFKGNLAGLQFVGLANFQVFAEDTRIPASFGHVMSYIAWWIPMMVLFVPLLALLLHIRHSAASSTVRFIYYLPSAITGAAGVIIWIFMLDPSVSPFAFIFAWFHQQSIGEVLRPDNLPFVYALMAFSTSMGTWVVTFFGALQNIPKELTEAASIDGCNQWQMAFYIKIPLISKYIIYMVMLVFATGFQMAAEPQIINAASQGRFGGYDWTPNIVAFEYAGLGKFGTAGAISCVLLLLSIGIALFLIFRTDFYRTD